MMLNGLQEVEIHQNRAVLYLDKEAKAMTLGLGAIFNKVEQELKETIKRSFTIETRETKDRNQNKLNQDTIENLKNLFGDDLNIKDKR